MVTVLHLNSKLIGSTNRKIASLLLLSFLALSLVSLFPIPVAQAQTWTDISTFPYTISSGGYYRVTTAYTGAGPAITITANDVTLDGQNYALAVNDTSLSQEGVIDLINTNNIVLYNINITSTGTGADSEGLRTNTGSGIRVTNSYIGGCPYYAVAFHSYLNSYFENVTIGNSAYGFCNANTGTAPANMTFKNCTFINNTNTGWDGRTDTAMLNTWLENCTFTNNAEKDFYYSGKNATLLYCTFNTAKEAINFVGFNDTALIQGCILNGNYSIVASDNSRGIDIQTSNGLGSAVTIINNHIKDYKYGIIPFAANNITTYNNFLNNTQNLWSASTIGGTAIFNTTRQQGTRVYTNGGLIGGNYYANPAGNGASQTGTDNNGDGFVDATYEIITGVNDYLPLSGNATAFRITASADTNSAITPTGAVTVYYGANQAFTFSANTGYTIGNLTVDGSSASTTSPYTFPSVTANHTISVFSESGPAPSNSPNPTQRIGSSLIGNLALFGILPIAVGAMVFFVALKSFGQSGENTSEVVLPALFSAIIITVMVEICVYVAVFVVSAMP